MLPATTHGMNQYMKMCDLIVRISHYPFSHDPPFDTVYKLFSLMFSISACMRLPISGHTASLSILSQNFTSKVLTISLKVCTMVYDSHPNIAMGTSYLNYVLIVFCWCHKFFLFHLCTALVSRL